MTTLPIKNLADRAADLVRANAAYETAKVAALAARVPDDDIAANSEPITISGWYKQATVSGRPAWRKVMWVEGGIKEEAPTYNPDLEKALSEARYRQFEAEMAHDEQARHDRYAR